VASPLLYSPPPDWIMGRKILSWRPSSTVVARDHLRVCRLGRMLGLGRMRGLGPLRRVGTTGLRWPEAAPRGSVSRLRSGISPLRFQGSPDFRAAARGPTAARSSGAGDQRGVGLAASAAGERGHPSTRARVCGMRAAGLRTFPGSIWVSTLLFGPGFVPNLGVGELRCRCTVRAPESGAGTERGRSLAGA